MPSLIYSWERTLIPTEKEAGWAPEPVWMFGKREKNLSPYWDSNPQIV
jgi:hypothetical protein